MTGRGIDQALPHPCSPELHESYIRDARDYVALAEAANGTFIRPVSFHYIWGDALDVLREQPVDLRIINLETSVTQCDEAWPQKGINYRMHPRNIGCLVSAKIDACSLANNHTVDWGFAGLRETIATLANAGILCAGAGESTVKAAAPAILKLADGGRVILFGYGSTSSGVPKEWRSTADSCGLNVLSDLSESVADKVIEEMRMFIQTQDIAVASIHWGNNWGYQVPYEEVKFAHRLIDGGFHLVHGHSSHHPKAMEVYRGRLILYGCGDFINDYEGISGFEEFRPDLALMYFVELASEDGRLLSLRIAPMQRHRFQLKRPSSSDAAWICRQLNKLNAAQGIVGQLTNDCSIQMEF